MFCELDSSIVLKLLDPKDRCPTQWPTTAWTASPRLEVGTSVLQFFAGKQSTWEEDANDKQKWQTLLDSMVTHP